MDKAASFGEEKATKTESARAWCNELAPRDSRGWACLGRACLELSDVDEAHGALRRSVRLEHEGSYETFASILLESLGSGASEQRR